MCSQVEVLYIDDAPLSYLQTDMIMSGENNCENITQYGKTVISSRVFKCKGKDEVPVYVMMSQREVRV